MELTLAKLLYAFDIEAVESIEDFGTQNTYIFWEKRPLNVRMSQQHSEELS
jgi:hypothetical protein